jgi:hypothetical protein
MVIVVLLVALLVAPMASPSRLAAQAHEHGASAPAPDARLELVLGGPHLILYHTGYLALGEAQVAGLQRLRRAVCEAEVVYVERTATARDRLSALLADSVSLPRESTTVPARSSGLPDAMNALAAAETAWLTALLRARRDALGLLTTPQRAQQIAERLAFRALQPIAQHELTGALSTRLERGPLNRRGCAIVRDTAVRGTTIG